MAANDYYTSTAYPSRPYRDYDNHSLPPLPSSHSQSPFNDSSYPYSHQTPSQSYAGSSGRNDGDPFDDENSIPLSGRKKHDSTATDTPILPHQIEDPFVRDADPRKKRRRKMKEGWFKGKITWVVYVLTAVQLVVFIAEIIKNGECNIIPQSRSAYAIDRAAANEWQQQAY